MIGVVPSPTRRPQRPEYLILRVGEPFHISALRRHKRSPRRKDFWWRILTPEQECAVRQALAAGAEPKVLAVAYGVSTRTVFRCRERARGDHREVHLAGWRATFVLTDDGPMQATAWVPA